MTPPLILSPIPALLKAVEGLVPERPNLWLVGVLGALDQLRPGELFYQLRPGGQHDDAVDPAIGFIIRKYRGY